MKIRDLAMISVGCVCTALYQKYNKQMMKAMKDTLDSTVRKTSETLSNMM